MITLSRLNRIILVLLIILLWTNLYSQNNAKEPFPFVKPENVGFDSEKVQVFIDSLENWLARDEMIGAVIHIIKDRKTVLHKAVGWRNREDGIPMETNTICRLRSMTKPFVGTSILMLSEANQLSLSDPVARHVPFYRNEKCDNITVRQLLHHTGGFRQPGYPFGAPFYPNLDSLVKTIGKSGPTHEPGSRYSYSDAGSSTLAYTVTLLSGMPVEDFIQQRILDKFHMSDTFCFLTEEDSRRPRVSCTYAGKRGNWNRYWDNTRPQQVPYFRGSGGMYSTTTDYARFLAMWMDKGSVNAQHFLKPETVHEALTPSSLSRGDTWGYGYQWEVYSISKGVFSHSGSDGTLAMADPENDLMLLYFTQSRGGKTVSWMRKLFFKLFYE